MDELTPLRETADEPPGAEVLRAWVVDDEMHCALHAEAFPDPATWGLFLADLARHVAEALHQNDGRARAETVRLIRQAFDAETDRPQEPGGE
jgi:hypothetical protein